MDKELFERIAEEAFESLPENFKGRIDNVSIVVEDLPSRETVERMGLPSRRALLGLYEGVPLTQRGTWYGMYPVAPDKITLYRMNIEAEARTEAAVRARIRDVLIHEIGHYFGMSEEEIRLAGY